MESLLIQCTLTAGNNNINEYDNNSMHTIVELILFFCRCRIPPTKTSVPAPQNTLLNVLMNIPKIAKGTPTRAPYTVNFYRANSEAIIASVDPNIDWKRQMA